MRRFAHEPAAFDAPVILRDRERIGPRVCVDLCAVDRRAVRGRRAIRRRGDGNRLDRLAVHRDVMRIRAGAQQVSIETRFFADRPGLLAAVAERNRDRIIGVTR